MNALEMMGAPALLFCALAPSRANKVEDFIRAEMQKLHIPGLSIAVVRDGKVVLATGYGLANVEFSVPATKETMYQLLSVTKMFTGTAIMMLIEEGKLSLDDPVTKLLPDLPATWSAVTVRHCLSHTSGLKDFLELPEWERVVDDRSVQDAHSPDEIVPRVSQCPLEFRPGESWSYNHTGYFLLGRIIERASGKPYAGFLDERIFRPLGMTATRFGDYSAVMKNRAGRYLWKDNTLSNLAYFIPTWIYTGGGLNSTVLDLAKWDAAFDTERLLKKSSLQKMWTPFQLHSGRTAGYGLGWYVGEYSGHGWVGHSGGAGLSNLIRFVDDKLTVILLTNLDSGDSHLAEKVATFYLP
jgi:D-alanyl-D-alanine carboxypeptidase